jgi:hypothetical protein
MPSWPDIQADVRERFPLAKDEPDHFSLVFEYEDGRTQLVTVRHFTPDIDGRKQDWLEFSSIFCREGEMHPKAALKRNDGFVVGGIAQRGEFLIFRHTVPLATLDPEEFELPLHYVARTADQLEATFASGDQF